MQKNINLIKKYHLGVSMVEILVTVVIISIGLLGVAALHTVSLRNNYEAHVRSQATVLAQNISDRMRANYTAATDDTSNPYQIAIGTVITLSSTPSLIDKDLHAWKTILASELPSGDGSIARNIIAGSKVFTITIQWVERTDSGTSTSSYVTQVEI